jgi:hypothetical protein
MHLSRGVLIALALGASNVAARPQFSFNLAFNIGPEEQPSSHSNPEPTTSAARVQESSSSGAGNLFRGRFRGSNDHTTSQPDGQKTPLTSNTQQAHARPSNAAGRSVVFDGLKSGSASYTTVPGPISAVDHSSSNPPPSKKQTIPAGRPSNGLNGNSQYDGGGSPSQAGQSSPTITKVGTAQSEGQPPVSTGLV